MTQSHELMMLAEASLLAPSGLDAHDLERTMGHLLGTGVDTADIFLQATRHESWALEDGIVKEGAHSIDRGVGIRGISGEKTGFAYSNYQDLRIFYKFRKRTSLACSYMTYCYGCEFI